MNNKVVPYFYRYYGVTPQLAGVLGSCFGLMNLFARSWGGLLSDALNKRYGMRGRIWGMWVSRRSRA
jgi:NNP family nitrate/nitrite transporter-like MFS transporter